MNNNPVNLKDSTGEWPELTANQKKVAIGLAVIGACALVAGIAVVTGGAGAAIAVGALKGAITGATIGAASGAATNGAITYVTSGGDIEATKKAAIDGAADGFMTGAITGAITGGIKGAKTSSCNSGHCFVAGTRVQTDEGLVPIEDIQEGDYVLSCDPETGDVAYKRVLETYVNETYELIHLTVDHEEITTTHGHPFYVKDIGFVKAGDLVEGAILVDEEGNELHPQTKKWEYLQDPAIVYNFAVEDYHTYYVGYNRVLVHNVCGDFKTTNHGDLRLAERGFSDNKVKDIISNYFQKVYQQGGVEVYAKKTNGFYDVIIKNSNNEIITAVGGNTKSLKTWSDVVKMLNNNGGFSSLPW